LDRDPAGTEGLTPEPATAARDGESARASRLIVPALAVGVLVGIAVAQLWRLCRSGPTLPLWDEAAHAFAGVQVADALRHFNPLELFLALNRQVVWPFVHSLLLAPAFLAGGNGFAAAEAASLALYAATILALFAAGTMLHPTRGALIGLAAAALALMAPSWRLFGSLAMLEVPGALLLVTAFALHVRAAEGPLVAGRVRAAGIATTALFLCKYNYGLMWLVPLALWEWSLLPGEFRARARAALRRRMTARWWLRPMPLLFALGAVAIAAILATGGGEFLLGGQRVSVRSPGNLAYVLWLAGLAWLQAPRRGRETRAAWVWARLPEKARWFTQTIVIPLAVWFTLPYPNRVKEFFGFVANRDSGARLWTAEGLLFYPRALAADYSPAPWVAWSVLALALVAPLALWRRGRGGDGRDAIATLAVLALAVGLAATVLHRYRDSRFLFTVCPLLWLCAAATAVRLLDGALRRLPLSPLREAAWSLVAALIVTSTWAAAPGDFDLVTRRAALRGPASTGPAMDEVLDAVTPRLVAPDFSVAAFDPAPLPAPDPNRDFPPRAVLLGYGNVLSPGLLAWRARLARPDVTPERLPKRAPFVAPGAEDAAIDARVRWLEERADLVVVALADAMPRPLAGEYRRETWADRETAARLAESGNWARTREARHGEWRVAVFERVR